MTPPSDGSSRPPADGPPPPVPSDDWKILSVPVDEPPAQLLLRVDDDSDSDADAADPFAGLPPAATAGPPGGRTFSLEGRPAPALYLLAWLLSVGGIAVLFVTSQAAPSLGRSLFVIGAIVAIALGLASAAGYQVVARADRDPARYRGPAPLLVFGVVLAISTLVSGLLAGVVDGETPFGFLLGLLIVFGAYVLTVWLFAVRTGALTWAQMGWPTVGPDRMRVALRGIGFGALVMLPAMLGILILSGIVAAILGVDAPSVVPTASTSVEAFAVALAAAIVAPIGEELFFRGFALSAWARDLPERSALVRSAAFFAFVHIANINAASFREGASQALLQVVVIFPVGLVLGWLFLRRGIMASIAGHVTYNGLLLMLMLLANGTTTGS